MLVQLINTSANNGSNGRWDATLTYYTTHNYLYHNSYIGKKKQHNIGLLALNCKPCACIFKILCLYMGDAKEGEGSDFSVIVIDVMHTKISLEMPPGSPSPCSSCSYLLYQLGTGGWTLEAEPVHHEPENLEKIVSLMHLSMLSPTTPLPGLLGDY